MKAAPGRTRVARPGEAAVEGLRRRFRGELVLAGDERYDERRAVWNGMIDRRPALIARPTGVADVVAAIRFARDNELPVSVRGGGHNVAGTAVLDDGVVIDLSLMKGIRIDPLRRTVRAQGGVTWGELDRETQLLGMAVAGGIVSDTGIAGLTLNGGLSWHRRKHGMSIDNLASADVVTADGRLLVASEAQNPDLFWAIRGGGGNFGVVTSFEYHMNRIGPEVAFALVFYPIEELVRVASAWREFVSGAPDEITADLLVWTVPPSPGLPEELHGRPFVGVAALYAGAADHGMRMLRPLRVLSVPLLDLTGTMPYTTAQAIFDGFFPAGVERRYWKSLYLRGIPGDAIREIEQRMARAPSPRTLLSIRHLGGEIARVPADATAFGDRAAPFLLSVDSTWLDAHDDDENIAWTRSFWLAMRRWSNGQVYFNFPGLLEESDLLVSASYGDNFERLRILKTKYDPTNFFRMNQNIRPI